MVFWCPEGIAARVLGMVTTVWLNGANMNKIRADIRKNRIYICLEKGNREEIKNIVNTIERECRKLQRGFSCVTDIRNYTPIPETDEDLLFQAQIILWQAGMARVVRVKSSTSEKGQLQFEKASRLSAGYSAFAVDSIEDAERLLDSEMSGSEI